MKQTMPMDTAMYWREIDGGDSDTPPVPAPIWEFCDEADAPEHMSLTDADGLVLLDV